MDEGTTFRIYLPRVHSEDESDAPDATPVEMLHGNETILIKSYNRLELATSIRRALDEQAT